MIWYFFTVEIYQFYSYGYAIEFTAKYKMQESFLQTQQEYLKRTHKKVKDYILVNIQL